MKKAFLLIVLFFSCIAFSQEFKIKKAVSPQFGKIPVGKTIIDLSNSKVILSAGKKTQEFEIDQYEEIENQKIYTGKKGKNDIRFTLFINEGFIRFENKEDFSGKVNEINYFF